MDAELRKLARRMLMDYDARTPNQIFHQPLTLTTDEAYQLQGEVGRLRAHAAKRSSVTRLDASVRPFSNNLESRNQFSAACSIRNAIYRAHDCHAAIMPTSPSKAKSRSD